VKGEWRRGEGRASDLVFYFINSYVFTFVPILMLLQDQSTREVHSLTVNCI
jgi:hypothetical protein